MSPPSASDPAAAESYALHGDGVHVEVRTRGATLARVSLTGQTGQPIDVVGRNADGSSHPYAGATVGRFCRNVSYGSFNLDDVEYHLDLNDGVHHMHGGSDGFSRRLWTADPDTAATAVRFSLTSPNGDQGYPGELRAETTYRLRGTTLTIEYLATTTAPTIVDLTNHAYWNLAGSGTIDGHTLKLDASQVVPLEPGMVPTQDAPRPVFGNDDFQEPRTLRGESIDRFFILDPDGGATLTHPASGRSLRILDERPGIGVYTADRSEPRRSGIALQPSGFPDAPNRPDFPSVRLDPDRTYRSSTSYRLCLGPGVG